MTTTTTTCGADFSRQTQADGIYAYLSGGDYTSDQREALADALMSALSDEVDQRLPGGVVWTPSTSEFLHPVGADLPDREAMDELFREAWAAVEARYQTIEAETIGAQA